MVGLSVILENQRSNNNIISEKNPQVINKTSMLINTTTKVVSQLNYQVPPFLQQCFLCKHKLLPGKDIYMYKGDRAFCSVECRCRQINMDEDESFADIKPSTSSSSATRYHHKAAAARNRGGGFAY